MPIERAKDGTDDFVSDMRQASFHLVMVKDFVREVRDIRLTVKLLQFCKPRIHLFLGETKSETSRLAMRDINTGLAAENRSKVIPFLGGSLCPGSVSGHCQAFRLHPDQSEITARSPKRDISFIKQYDTFAASRE